MQKMQQEAMLKKELMNHEFQVKHANKTDGNRNT